MIIFCLIIGEFYDALGFYLGIIFCIFCSSVLLALQSILITSLALGE